MTWLVVLLFPSSLPLTSQPPSSLVQEARLHPESFSANSRLGEYYVKQNEFAAAIPYLEKARQLNPTDYANSYDLALTYLQVKSISKSRRLVTGLIEQHDSAELHNLLADIEEADGHVDEAAHQYELAARMDPTEKNLFDLGSDLLNHKGFKPALTVFDFGVKRYPQSAKLRVGLGVSYYSVGQYDNAVQTLCQAVDLDPQDTKALNFLGKMNDISPQYGDEVTKRLAGFVRLYPKNAAAQFYYGLSLRKRNAAQSAANDREAETYLARAIEIQPDFTDAHFELGVLYQDLQEDHRAIAQFEIATKQRPDFLQAHYRLAQLYKKTGNTALARKEFSRIEALKINAVP
jgi:tetratricopeptide (TPR) repeat protein